MTKYISKATVLAIHQDQIDRFGGSHGIRDEGLLEAAIFRPQTGYYRDLIEEAAALWESLSQNHPFIDGNKRAAFGSLCAFLGANGAPLQANVEEAMAFVTGLYESNSFRFDQLVSWLREHTTLPKILNS
jgi:death-on-curing protein